MSSLIEHLIDETIDFPKLKVAIPGLRLGEHRKDVLLQGLLLLQLVLLLHPLLPDGSRNVRYSFLLLPRRFRHRYFANFVKSLLTERTAIFFLNYGGNTFDHLLMQP